MYRLYVITESIGLFLQAILLYRLVSHRRSFPYLLVYIGALFVATSVEFCAFLIHDKSLYASSYWVDEIILDWLVFGLVLTLIHRKLRDAPGWRAAMLYMLAGAALVTFFSWWFGNTPGVTENMLMTEISRNLWFFAALMNVVLWLVLVRDPKRDRRLLLISGGLGLEATGQAISQALRSFTHSELAVLLPNLFGIATHLLCLYIWWRALAPDRNEDRLPVQPSVAI